MSEEEKNAVEKIKEIIECFYCFPNPTCIELKDCDCSTLEIALDLIEKLQKENEEKTILLFAGAEKVKQLEKEKEELKEKNLIQEAMIKDSISKETIKKFFIEKKK